MVGNATWYVLLMSMRRLLHVRPSPLPCDQCSSFPGPDIRPWKSSAYSGLAVLHTPLLHTRPLPVPPAPEFRPWKLAEEALRPGFAGKLLRELLGQIEKELQRKECRVASPEAVSQLAAALRQRAEQVWGGAAAAGEQLEELAALEAGGEEQEEEDRGQEGRGQGAQQQEQQQQAQQQAEQQAEQAEQQPAEAPAGKKQKRDVYHSKQARKEALLAKAAAQTAKKASSSAAAAGKARQASPGARLAAWLVPALRTLLAEPPTKLPGACWGRVQEVLIACSGLAVHSAAAVGPCAPTWELCCCCCVHAAAAAAMCMLALARCVQDSSQPCRRCGVHAHGHIIGP